ncbi:MAG: molybdenum cofactor guanylyltransferase [Anaerolineales bacterium]|nr:molybdenum cofactor guanylyltransferase [Anaerolineales bacterium]
MHKDLTVVIQAGGQSSRMGTDKGLVPLAGKLMIEHIISKVDLLGDELILVTNDTASYAYFGLRMVSDEEPGAGALPGLKTALTAATGTYVLIVACDMPFLNRDLLKHQIDLAFDTGQDVVIPRWDGHLQTMHAIYKKESCLPAVTYALEDNQKRMISFFPSVHVHKIEPDEVAQYDPSGRSFLNINTPEELIEAEKLIRSL